MNPKFDNVPIEADTRILRREIITVGGYEVLHERWSWEGVKGETMVFVSDDIAELSNDLLEKLARESPLVNPDSQMTIKRDRSGYSFVNFNFEC